MGDESLQACPHVEQRGVAGTVAAMLERRSEVLRGFCSRGIQPSGVLVHMANPRGGTFPDKKDSGRNVGVGKWTTWPMLRDVSAEQKNFGGQGGENLAQCNNVFAQINMAMNL